MEQPSAPFTSPTFCPRLVITLSLPLLSVCVEYGEPAAPARRRQLAVRARIRIPYSAANADSDGARALTLNGNCIPKRDLTIATYISIYIDIYIQTLADIKVHTAGLLPHAKALGNNYIGQIIHGACTSVNCLYHLDYSGMECIILYWTAWESHCIMITGIT